MAVAEELEISPYHISPEKDEVNKLVETIPGRIAIAISRIAAVGIGIANPGEDPYYYDRERIGQYGEPIELKKVHTKNGDYHHLRYGKILRATSIDEFAQLEQVPEVLNLVGPRSVWGSDRNNVRRLMIDQQSPIHPDTIFGMEDQMKPGITGVTQITPKPPRPFRYEWERAGYIFNMFEKLKPYLQHGTAEDDKKILMKTPWALIRGHGPTYPRDSDMDPAFYPRTEATK